MAKPHNISEASSLAKPTSFAVRKTSFKKTFVLIDKGFLSETRGGRMKLGETLGKTIAIQEGLRNDKGQ